MSAVFKFCPQCATPLADITLAEDGGDKTRLRCPACDFTHWNNPTPVLAAVIEYNGQMLLARNAAWPGKMYALITGFMEAGETPEEGIAREIRRRPTSPPVPSSCLGVYDFQRMNQVIIAYHAVCHGEVKLSPELVDYRLYTTAGREMLACWHRLCAGRIFALARAHVPQFIDPVWRKDIEQRAD